MYEQNPRYLLINNNRPPTNPAFIGGPVGAIALNRPSAVGIVTTNYASLHARAKGVARAVEATAPTGYLRRFW